MAEKADYVVAYVNRDWGGAYKTFEYAKKSKKKFLILRKRQRKISIEYVNRGISACIR